MKILQVCVALSGGGIDRYLYNYCTRMPEHDFDFAVVDTGSEGMLEATLRARGCRIFRLPRLRRGVLANARALTAVLRQGSYDAVHVHLGERSIIALWCAKRCRVPVRVAHAHIAGRPESPLARLARRLFSVLSRRLATDLMACGKEAACFVWGKRAVGHGRVTLCRNALILHDYAYSAATAAAVRRALGIAPSAPVIGNVGRLCAQKNQPRLVNIFCAVLRKRPDARLLLVGEGELHGQILALVEQYGLGDRVLLTGVRPDVGALLCAMDVFVLPSTHEGLPFSLLEAQCSGLPAIVSDTVTTEAALTDAVDFCSLDESDEHWAARIVDALDRARTPAPDALRRAGYDMDTEAGVLSRFYRERQSAAQEK